MLSAPGPISRFRIPVIIGRVSVGKNIFNVMLTLLLKAFGITQVLSKHSDGVRY